MKTLSKITVFLLLACPLWAQVQLGGNVQISGTTLICATPSGSTVATPTASPAAGSYSSTQSVTLSTSTGGATICYTTDGSTPTASAGSCTHGTTYTTAISVASSLTIEAIGTLSGSTNSGILSAAYTITGGGGTATPVLVPYIGPTGNYAVAKTSPVLTFGDQGTGTASQALPISISNCSTALLPACTGTGSLTVSSMAISGTNASDFVLTGTCSTIASGSDCEPTITFTPTAGSGTNETATLTVTDNGTTSTQTMSLTGTSATVTTLATSSCPTTLAASTKYQLTANISCGGTAFQYSGTGIDLNLNGHTVTYGTASQATQIGGVLNSGSGSTISIHNGTISHGAGTNTFSATPHPASSIIGYIGTNGTGNGSQFFNLTLNYNYQYAMAIEENGGNFVAHDNIINSTGVGTCASVGCRDVLQSSSIYQLNAQGKPSGGTQLYENTQNGGPQGGFVWNSPGAIIQYNYINAGNPTGTNTQNFAFVDYGAAADMEYNLILVPITSNSDARGILISDADNLGVGDKLAAHNYIGSFAQPNNTEYGGCEIGGTYGVQFDDNPVGTNISTDNIIDAVANQCGAQGIRVSESTVTTNESIDNTVYATRASGAVTCVQTTWADTQHGCAYGITLEGPTGFASSGDTFTADSGEVFISTNGGENVSIQSPTFNKGSNPSSFHTFVAQNGPVGGSNVAGVVHVVDAMFNSGVSPTDAVIFAQSANVGPASFYVDWTQNMTVVKASGPAASGALVTFTDTLSNTYTCTTNSSGVCSAVVTQYRDNNDTGANQVENRNPYGLAVSLSGCTTNTTSGLTISATGSRSITLSGC